jgi:hypothetical protein
VQQLLSPGFFSGAVAAAARECGQGQGHRACQALPSAPDVYSFTIT